MKDKITIIERVADHKERHPNDKNVRKSDKGVRYSKEEPGVDIMMMRKIMKKL